MISSGLTRTARLYGVVYGLLLLPWAAHASDLVVSTTKMFSVLDGGGADEDGTDDGVLTVHSLLVTGNGKIVLDAPTAAIKVTLGVTLEGNGSIRSPQSPLPAIGPDLTIICNQSIVLTGKASILAAGVNGGSIVLCAHTDIQLQGTTSAISCSASGPTGQPGTVLLDAGRKIRLKSGSSKITANGVVGGMVTLTSCGLDVLDLGENVPEAVWIKGTVEAKGSAGIGGTVSITARQGGIRFQGSGTHISAQGSPSGSVTLVAATTVTPIPPPTNPPAGVTTNAVSSEPCANCCVGDSACDDGNACTTGDICSAGHCLAGMAVDCDDANACTDDLCNPTTGCQHVNSNSSCDDGNVCTTDDSCSGGACAGIDTSAVDCDDANQCTDDSCDPILGCQHANSSAPCDDGNACTTGDACVAGACAGTDTSAMACNDGNPCTDDSCDQVLGCQHNANSVPCDDGLFCTLNDRCEDGVCGGTEDACPGQLCDEMSDSCIEPGFMAPLLNAHPSMTKEPAIAITGTASGAAMVEVSGPQSLFQVNVSGDAFSAEVPLAENQVNHVFFTAITASGIRSSPTPTAITNDAQPPNLFIDFPAGGAELTTPMTDVAGRVGDVLSGFLGLVVTVNGIPAVVDVGIGTNGTFLAAAVPVSPDAATVLSASATDALGNSLTKQITVTHVSIPDDASQLVLVSGAGQSAPIQSVLPEPVAVQILRGDGTPFANKIVTFTITRSDGQLTEDGVGPGTAMLQIRSNSEGIAQAFWRLGSDAGCGNNRITAASVGVLGTVFACASALPGPSVQINIGSGNSQRGEVNAVSMEPLRARVSDGCNGVAGVPVTFTVTKGGGKVNGHDSVSVSTGVTGHAEVPFVLGPNPGNNVVEANFLGNLTEPAAFVLFGLRRQDSQPTQFTGLVLDNTHTPLGGGRISLEVNGLEVASTTTDSAGSFTLEDIPAAGPADLYVDGPMVNLLGGQPVLPGAYPALHYEIVLVPNAVNSLSSPILLPALNPANVRMYDGNQDVELTCEGIEGLKMTVRAGTTVTLHDGTKIGPNDPGAVPLSLNQVHHDDVPMPMPDGAAPPFAWTLQPGRAVFDQPVEISYPNMTGLAPGAVSYFLSFNHDTSRFEIIATGTVSGDGSTITTDPGVGITTAGWGCNCPPYAVTGSCKRCNNPLPVPHATCDPGDVEFGRHPDNNQFNQNQRFENHIQWADAAASLKTGNLTVRHKCVPYRRLGATRGVELVYNSLTADPRPIISTAIEGGEGVFSTRLTVMDMAGQPVLPDIEEPFEIQDGVPAVHRAQVDASSLPTGIYPYTLEFTAEDGTISYTPDYMLVRNDLNSPVGVGWCIAEVHSLIESDDGTSMLLAHGNGSNTVFGSPTQGPPPENECGQPVPWMHPDVNGRTPGDFSELFVDDNKIIRQLTNGIRQVYDLGRLVERVDRNGNVTQYIYSLNTLAKIIDPTGAETTFEYEGGLLRYITDPAGRITELKHDEFGNVTKIIDPDLSEREFDYDASHRMVLAEDKANFATIYSYDVSTMRLESIRFPDAQGSTRLISPAQAVLSPDTICESEASYTDATGYLYEVSMDRFGRVLRIEDPSGATKRWIRDEDGLPTHMMDALERTTRMEYDERGNPIRTTLPFPPEPFNYIVERAYLEDFNFLEKYTDANGDETDFGYDDLGNLTSSTDALDHQSVFVYNSDGLPTAATDREGNTTTWSYCDGTCPPDVYTGLVKEWTVDVGPPGTALHLKTNFTYNDAGFPKTITDPRGVITTLEYDDMNRVTRRTVDPAVDPIGNPHPDALNLVTTFSYTQDGLIEEVTTADTAKTCYKYDERRRLKKIIDAELGETVFGYDAEGRLVSRIDAEERVTTVTHDLVQRRVTIVDPLSGMMTKRYDANNHLEEGTDERGTVTKYERDELDRITSRAVDPEGLSLTTLWVYPALGENGSAEGRQPRKIIDAEGNETIFEYDVLDRLTKETRVALDTTSAISKYDYDDEGHLSETIDPNQIATRFMYDGAYRLTDEILDPSGLNYLTHHGYDGVGNRTQTATPAGNVITNTYDDASRLISTTDLVGLVATNKYDEVGRITATFDGDGRRTGFEYDLLGRVCFIEDGLGIKEWFTYDKVGNRCTALDRNGNLTTFEYDKLNRLKTEIRPLAVTTGYEYDPVGNRRQIIDANGGLTTFGYDRGNRLTLQTFADGDSVVFDYDKVGNVLRQENQDGSEMFFVYDDLYRRLSRSYLEGTDTYEYDPGGRLTAANNAAAEVVVAYDKADRVTSIIQGAFTMAYQHVVSPQANNRTITYPSGRIIHENRDRRNRLASICEGPPPCGLALIASFEHNLADLKATRALVNNVVTTWGYDANRRLTAVTHTDEIGPGGGGAPVTFVDIQYGYDPVGNLCYSHRLHDEANSIIGSYDALNRLVSFQRGSIDVGADGEPSLVSPSSLTGLAQVQSWTNLDKLDNWLASSVTIDGLMQSDFRQANAVNEYLARGDSQELLDPQTGEPLPGAVPIAHDERGNTTDDGEYVYNYDTLNRLLSVTRKSDSAVVLQNTYDARDYRVRSVDGSGVSADFIFDHNWRLLEQRSGAQDPQTFVYGAGQDEIVQRQDGSTSPYYFHAGKLGTIEAITDGSGEVVESYRHDAYGRRLVYGPDGEQLTDSSVANAFGFAGRWHELDHLVDLRNRFYHTDLGRFIQRDPAGFADGVNLYRYASSSPLGRFDLFGLQDGEEGSGLEEEEQRQDEDPIVAEEQPATAIAGSRDSDGAASDPTTTSTSTTTTSMSESSFAHDAEDFLRNQFKPGSFSRNAATLIPGVDLVEDLSTIFLDESLVSGNEVTALDRGLATAGLLIPFVSGSTLKAAGKVVGEYGDEAIDLAKKAGEEVAEKADEVLDDLLRTGDDTSGIVTRGADELGSAAAGITDKIAKQMGPRGWTEQRIAEAIKSGQQIPAINKATGNPAVRYVHPQTGQSVVIDTVTNEVIQVGGPGFKYGPASGDLP